MKAAQQQQLLQVQDVDLLIGRVTIIVMMIITMPDVNGMVGIAVGMMSKHNTALIVNAWILMNKKFQIQNNL